MTSYEELRQRHVQDAMAAAGELIGRLDWPAKRLAAHRDAELRRLVRTAQAASPWHRKRLGQVDTDALDAGAMAELPVMTKDELMANFDEIVTDDRLQLDVVEDHLEALDAGDAYLFDRYHAVASGGSSGRRGVFVYDWHGWITAYFGILRYVMRELVTWSQPQPPLLAMVAAGHPSHITHSITRTFATPRLATRRFPVALPIEQIVTGLNDCQPTLLAGYPSMVHALARETRAGRLRVAPRFVLPSGEPLLPEARRDAAEAWQVPVLNIFACSETGPLGIPCPLGEGLHLPEDMVIVEPVDARGRPVRPGERSDKIYVTNLFNHTLPLIRYEITDEVTLLDEACPCGSAHRVIADPQGRQDDTFAYGDTLVHPHVFRSVLGRQRHIGEYQVRQTSRGATVAVVCHGPVDLPGLEAKLQTGLAELGVPTPEVSMRMVDSIERQASGKLCRFVPLRGDQG
jgi:phenylacetate-CoA ligase